MLLFLWGRLASDVVALLSLLALTLCGILDSGEALSGFGDPTVIMVASLFVVGEGLAQTGVTSWMGKHLLAMARGQNMRLLVVVMTGTACLSALMSNTGTVAALLPAVVAAAWSVKSLPSKHLMPLAFAANAGGLLTLTGTPPNLVVSRALEDSGGQAFGFFEFSLVGVPLLLLTVVYMATLGRRLLPSRGAEDRPMDVAEDLAALADTYSLGKNRFRLRIREASSLSGKRIDEALLGSRHNAPLVRVEGRTVLPSSVLRPDDVLVVRTQPDNLDELISDLSLSLLPADETPATNGYVSSGIGMAEILLTPRSELIGKPLRIGQVTENYRVQVMGVRRQGSNLEQETTLEFGDSILVRGMWEDIRKLRDEHRDFVVVGTPEAVAREMAGLRPEAPVAIAALAGMVLLMVMGWVPAVMATLLAAVAMLLGRCVSSREAYRAVSWSSVVLIAAMLPMGRALEVTGGAAFLAAGLVDTLGALSPIALLTGIFLITAGFSQVISNTATAVLVAPIVLQAASELGLSPEPLLMMVAVSASTACLTPIATPTNLLVLSPGGYRFGDYVRVGLPLMVLVLLASLVLVPLIWPLAIAA